LELCKGLIAQEAITPRSQINLKESRFLGRLVSSLEYEGPIIEIGTLFGWSTRIICQLKETDRELISVDNYSWNPFKLPPDIHFETTKQILSEAISEYNLKLLRMDNVDFYELIQAQHLRLFSLMPTMIMKPSE